MLSRDGLTGHEGPSEVTEKRYAGEQIIANDHLLALWDNSCFFTLCQSSVFQSSGVARVLPFPNEGKIWLKARFGLLSVSLFPKWVEIAGYMASAVKTI